MTTALGGCQASEQPSQHLDASLERDGAERPGQHTYPNDTIAPARADGPEGRSEHENEDASAKDASRQETPTPSDGSGASDGSGTFDAPPAGMPAGQDSSAQPDSPLACVPETDRAFCTRLNKACGRVSGPDNCDRPRTVEECGPCTGKGEVCGGPGLPANVCSSWCKGYPWNERPVFTSNVTDLARVSFIHPLGAAWGGEIRGHTYVQSDGPQPVPVVLPVDAHLESIIYLAYWDEPTRGDWGLRFRPSCEVMIKFGHVTHPISDITKLWNGPPAQNSSQWLDLKTPVPFAAGTQIATTTGTRETNNWDFGVLNLSVENRFANQSRYAPPEVRPGDFNSYVNADCPYDYFAEPLRPAYLSRLGSILAGAPVAGATCRSAVRDVAGTAAGAWWLSDTPDPNYAPRIGIVSEYGGYAVIGGIGVTKTISLATTTPPETVTSGHCYATGTEFVALKLVSGTELHVAHGTGSCPVSFPSSGFKVYVR